MNLTLITTLRRKKGIIKITLEKSILARYSKTKDKKDCMQVFYLANLGMVSKSETTLCVQQVLK